MISAAGRIREPGLMAPSGSRGISEGSCLICLSESTPYWAHTQTCVHVHTHSCACLHMHTFIDMNILYTCSHGSTCRHVHTGSCVHGHMPVHVYVHTCAHTEVLHMHICTHNHNALLHMYTDLYTCSQAQSLMNILTYLCTNTHLH